MSCNEKEEFDKMRSLGLVDALLGRYEDVDKVFDEIDDRIAKRACQIEQNIL